MLTEALAAGGEEAKRAFDAMMGMRKIDVAAIKAAASGEAGGFMSAYGVQPSAPSRPSDGIDP